MRNALTILCLLSVLLLLPGAARPCSVFTADDGVRVLAGNNEDYYAQPPTAIWFVPPAADKYGFAAYGYTNDFFSQGGMNDQGLFFDGLATPYLDAETDPSGLPLTAGFLEDVLQRCATVDEAINRLFEYNLDGLIQYCQLLFADRFGDAAIVEGDEIIRKEDNYLIATNFYHSHPELGYYPCERYEVLEEMMQDVQVTRDYFAAMADAARQGETVESEIFTRYTTVADLVEGVLYLYYELDYSNYLAFNLAEELADGGGTYLMDELFGDDDNPSDDDDNNNDDDDQSDDDDDDDDDGCGC